MDLLLEVDSGGDGQVHGVLSRGDAAIRCHLSGANAGLSGLSHTAFASSSKLFGQRHCPDELNDRRVCGMG